MTSSREPSLFDKVEVSPRKLARRTDPETSHQGARDAVGDGTVGRLQRLAVEAVKRSPGRTYSELGKIEGMDDPRTLGRRLVEMDRAGLVRRGEARRCKVTNRNAAVWYPREKDA